MISRLSGALIYKSPPQLIIDVNGIAYEMQAPMSTFYKLPEVGESVTVLTHFIVREDAQRLYAFLSEYDRSLFRELLKVSGIGPKVALAILSGIDPATFKECVLNKDIQTLVRLPGIGEKTAERLVVEMKNRFNDEFWVRLDGSESAADGSSALYSTEAVQALVTLGYKPAEARRLIKQVDKDDSNNVEEIIRRALKQSLT